MAQASIYNQNPFSALNSAAEDFFMPVARGIDFVVSKIPDTEVDRLRKAFPAITAAAFLVSAASIASPFWSQRQAPSAPDETAPATAQLDTLGGYQATPLNATNTSSTWVDPDAKAGIAPTADRLAPWVNSLGTLNAATTEQMYFENDSWQLKAAMNACDNNQLNCDPNVRPFAAFMHVLAKEPNQMVQIEAVNAYVNSIPYDHGEAAQKDSNYKVHTLQGALDIHKVTCFEAAELKDFMLAQLPDFKKSDIQVLLMNDYSVKAPHNFMDAHAITIAEVGKTMWALNLDSDEPVDPMTKKSVTTPREAIIADSSVQPAGASLNLSPDGNSMYYNREFVPNFSFNDSGVSTFNNAPAPDAKNSNIPMAARTAPADWQQLDIATLKKDGLLEPLLQAEQANGQGVFVQAEWNAEHPFAAVIEQAINHAAQTVVEAFSQPALDPQTGQAALNVMPNHQHRSNHNMLKNQPTIAGSVAQQKPPEASMKTMPILKAPPVRKVAWPFIGR